MSLQKIISFKLIPGRDDDIINWIASLGSGERSFFIRQALRHYFRNRENIIITPVKENGDEVAENNQEQTHPVCSEIPASLLESRLDDW